MVEREPRHDVVPLLEQPAQALVPVAFGPGAAPPAQGFVRTTCYLSRVTSSARTAYAYSILCLGPFA